MATILDRSDVRVRRSVPDPAGTWRQAVDELSQSTLAHSPEWFTVVRNAYGHDPLYLSAEDDEGRLGLLPAYWVFWKAPLAADQAPARRSLTWLLAFVVWWGFLVGHVLNNIKGLVP